MLDEAKASKLWARGSLTMLGAFHTGDYAG
jgi:hypothetical protein